MPGFEWLGEEERARVNEVMDRGVLFRYEFGDQREGVYEVREFEKAFAKYTGASHALAVTSGSTALKVALAALGVGPGDEVITQGFTFVATWEAIFDAGAVPVFCEVDDSLCMDPADLEGRITDKTACIIPVHMMGSQARIKEIVAIADKHGIPVLEDTAQSAGLHPERPPHGHLRRHRHLLLRPGENPHLRRGRHGHNQRRGALPINASEYHDHGHDHKPVGRGNEGRRFFRLQLPHDGAAGRHRPGPAGKTAGHGGHPKAHKGRAEGSPAKGARHQLPPHSGRSRRFGHLPYLVHAHGRGGRPAWPKMLAEQGAPARFPGASTPGIPIPTGSTFWKARRSIKERMALQPGPERPGRLPNPTHCPRPQRAFWGAACPGRSCWDGTRPSCSR